MFENERFEERADLEYQKDIITYIVIAVIFFSVFYYCVVFVSEVFAWHPKWLLVLFASKKARKAAKLDKKLRVHGPSLGSLDEDVVMDHLDANPMGSKKTLLAATESESKLRDLTASDMLRDQQLTDMNLLCGHQKDQIIRLQQILRRYKKDDEFAKTKASSRPAGRKRTIGSKKTFDQTDIAIKQRGDVGGMEMMNMDLLKKSSKPSLQPFAGNEQEIQNAMERLSNNPIAAHLAQRVSRDGDASGVGAAVTSLSENHMTASMLRAAAPMSSDFAGNNDSQSTKTHDGESNRRSSAMSAGRMRTQSSTFDLDDDAHRRSSAMSEGKTRVKSARFDRDEETHAEAVAQELLVGEATSGKREAPVKRAGSDIVNAFDLL